MKILIVAVLAFLVGCAGVTEYEVTTPDGVMVKVRNSKDYDSYTLNAGKQADGSYSVQLIEEGVSASNPLRAAQELNSELIDKVLGAVL
tara:strand:+ start:7352 stop:7618 length:267 start_codon:yes stop_codon:yes gene_type:complete